MTLVAPDGRPLGPDGQPIDSRQLLSAARTAIELARAQVYQQQALIIQLEEALMGLLQHGALAIADRTSPRLLAAQAALDKVAEVRAAAQQAQARALAQVQGKVQP